MSTVRCFVVAFLCLPLMSGAAWAQDDEMLSEKPTQAPPPMEEIVVPQPGENAVWIPGHWDRKKDQWVWQKGEWVRHPLPNAYWVPPHWQQSSGKWRWQNGEWAYAPEGYVISEVIEIPDKLKEDRPPKPANANFWVPGYWDWSAGTWMWVPGRWTNKPHEKAEWVTGNWEKFQGQERWRWMTGHWKLPVS